MQLMYIYRGSISTISFMCVQQFAVFSDLLGLLSLGYVIFSWYWTTKGILLVTTCWNQLISEILVFKNVTGIISGSIIGKWYFYQSEPTNSINSGKETSICSFGSICLAALIIPPFSLLDRLSSCSFSKTKKKSQAENTVYSQCNKYAYTHVSSASRKTVQVLTCFRYVSMVQPFLTLQ